MYLNSSKLATVSNLMLNLNTFKSNTKLTILPTLCDTGKLERGFELFTIGLYDAFLSDYMLHRTK